MLWSFSELYFTKGMGLTVSLAQVNYIFRVYWTIKLTWWIYSRGFSNYFTVSLVMSCCCDTSNPPEESLPKAELDAYRSVSVLSLCVCVQSLPIGLFFFISVTLNQLFRAIQVAQGQSDLWTNLSSI